MRPKPYSSGPGMAGRSRKRTPLTAAEIAMAQAPVKPQSYWVEIVIGVVIGVMMIGVTAAAVIWWPK